MNEKSKQRKLVDSWLDAFKRAPPPPGCSPEPRNTRDIEDWWKDDQEPPEELIRLISEFRTAESALEDFREPASSLSSPDTVILPLKLLLSLLPAQYRCDESSVPDDLTAPVVIPGLLDQLAHGKAQVSVAGLAFGIPADLIMPNAGRNKETMIDLPLADVVRAVDPALLLRSSEGTARTYRTTGIPDPFKEELLPDEAPGGVAPPSAPATQALPLSKPPTAAPEPLPPPPPPESPVPVATESPTPAPAKPSPPPISPPQATPLPVSPPAAPQSPLPAVTIAKVSDRALERLTGVDLNSAGGEELMSLSGITERIMRGILEYRRTHGPFQDVFDLQKVPGIGRTRFQQITGMRFSRTGHHRREVMLRLLNLPADSAGHLPTIVSSIAGSSGLSGCMITDRDGLLLAEAGFGVEAEAFSAVITKLFAQVSMSVSDIADEPVETVSISIGNRFFTVAAGGDIYLTALHEANRLTKGQFRFIKRVARELEWLLSHRGYVSG